MKNAFAAFAVRRSANIHLEPLRDARAANVVDADLLALIRQRWKRRASTLDGTDDHPPRCVVVKLHNAQ